MIDQKVIAFENYADVYSNRFKDISLYEDHLRKIGQLFNDDGKIVDFACGPCIVSQYIFSERPDLSFDCVDISPSMIEIGREKIPGANFHISDIRDFDYNGQMFNGAVCSFGFPFLSIVEIDSFIKRMSQNLLENSYVYISTMQGETEGYETTSFSGESEIHFIYHRKEKLDEIFLKYGFSIVDYTEQLFPQDTAEDLIDMIYILKFG